jgi:hypothetical protein
MIAAETLGESANGFRARLLTAHNSEAGTLLLALVVLKAASDRPRAFTSWLSTSVLHETRDGQGRFSTVGGC